MGTGLRLRRITLRTGGTTPSCSNHRFRSLRYGLMTHQVSNASSRLIGIIRELCDCVACCDKAAVRGLAGALWGRKCGMTETGRARSVGDAVYRRVRRHGARSMVSLDRPRSRSCADGQRGRPRRARGKGSARGRAGRAAAGGQGCAGVGGQGCAGVGGQGCAGVGGQGWVAVGGQGCAGAGGQWWVAVGGQRRRRCRATAAAVPPATAPTPAAAGMPILAALRPVR